MKIALFGAGGMIGRRIAREALSRGHTVTGITRNPAALDLQDPHFTAVAGDARDPECIITVAAGHDVVVSAIGPAAGEPAQVLIDAAHALIEAIGRTPGQRLLVVGGAGSLEVAPGVQLVDTPEFPAAWKSGALAAREALQIFRASTIDWTYISPAALIQPGERTGAFRLGTDQLLTNEKGESAISAEDFAVAIVDEIETPQFIRRRFTVAY